jgi:hypothetical protein
MAVMCDRLGIPIWEVLDAANTKPFAFMKHSPGPGVGGHCIPVVPFYLEAVAREHGLNSGLVETAGRINAEQPRFVVQKLGRLLGERGKTLRNARVLCLGVTYKPNVADLRESAALAVLEELLWQGADASYWDPFFPEVNAGRRQLRSVELSDEVVSAADAVVLLVPHSGPDLEALARKSRLVLDSMNVLAGRGLAAMDEVGLDVLGVFNSFRPDRKPPSLHALANYLRLLRYRRETGRSRTERLIYPRPLRYKNHAEFGCQLLKPGTTADELVAAFDEARQFGGDFCLATHYWEIDDRLAGVLRSIVEYAERAGVDFVAADRLFDSDQTPPETR